MTAEYSYFRAEGKSLTAIQVVTEAREELKREETLLATRFGADKIYGYYSAETRRYEVHYFHFKPPKAAPKSWLQTHEGGPEAAQYALPAPGSADYFNMRIMADLMTHPSSHLGLEDAFHIAQLPMHDMQDGQRISKIFVRAAMAEGAGDKKPGQVSGEDAVFGVLSGGPWKAADGLSFMEMDGDYYIRVPNRKGTETPAFVPPEAVPVSYDDMLSIDAREQNKRFNDILANTYNGYCC